METTLEERVSTLEAQIARLLEKQPATKAEVPWYERWYGAFKKDEMFDSAMRLGEEYRRSQPTAADEIKALEKAGVYVPLPDGH